MIYGSCLAFIFSKIKDRKEEIKKKKGCRSVPLAIWCPELSVSKPSKWSWNAPCCHLQQVGPCVAVSVKSQSEGMRAGLCKLNLQSDVLVG